MSFGGFVRWPRLSVDLPNPRAIDRCQSCGGSEDLGARVRLWMECDDEDQATDVALCLCDDCAGKIVQPHPRLYVEIPRNKPWPGAMACCAGCVFLDSLACKSPELKAHGGRGFYIEYSQPRRIHVNLGRRGGQWIETYDAPPLCRGRATTPPQTGAEPTGRAVGEDPNP